MNAARRNGTRCARRNGQALVETALVLPLFMLMLLGLVDVGRAIYTYNAVSEAAREIARRTIVHPGITLGQSVETQDTLAVQRAMIPGLADPSLSCVDASGAPNGHVPCQSGDYVNVTLTAPYRPLALLGIGGTLSLSSSSTMQIP